MLTAHSVTFDQGFSSCVPYVVRMLMRRLLSIYISRVDLTLPVPCIANTCYNHSSRSRHYTQEDTITR